MRRLLNPVLAYRLLIGLLVLLGIQPLLRLPQEIGQLYLGVPLTPLFTGEFFINIETSSHWPGIQAGLRARDRVLGIEGRSVIHASHMFAEVYAGRREGDPVQVEVQRGAERLTVAVPLRRYRLAEALELFGLWFLAGLSAAVAAWLLFRPATALMAHAMALLASLLFVHSYTGYADPRLSVTGFYPLEPMWAYGYSLLGAVLLHFAWRFPPREPADHSSAWRVSWKLVGLYGLVFALGTMLEFATVIKWVEANQILTQVGLMLAAVGATGGLLRLAWLCTRPLPGQAGARVIAGVWGIGTVLLLGIGVVPYWSSDLGMLLAQFLLSIAVIYPLLLVYAVRQVELVGALEREVSEKQRWADLAQELRRFREEDLRRVANELHDTVLADLRAVATLTDDVLALLPGWPLAVHSKAHALRRLGCPAVALQALEVANADTDDVGRPRFNTERARCLLHLGRRDEVLALARQVQAEAGVDSSILTDCADLLVELGAAAEAEGLYTRTIELKDSAEHRRNRALFYIRQGRYAQAETDLARATEEEPWHPDTYGRRGQLALAQGQFTRALEAFEEASRRDPHNVRWRYCLAFAHMGLGQSEQAVSFLKEALDRTELHEQVQVALQDVDLLAQAKPDLPELDAVRERILDRKALLDRLAEEECGGRRMR